jgi:4-amino-4-deoxy-L-arabinose transferase-like glycosyltransferase
MNAIDVAAHRWGRPAARWSVAAAGAALLLMSIVNPAPLNDRDRVLLEAVSHRSASGTLFVNAGDALWYQPLAVYPTAALLAAGIPIEQALRLPSALAGVLTVLLTYALALRVTGRDWAAAWAAILLLLFPGFVALARAPAAELMVVPLVLAWLVAVVEHIERPRTWLPFAGGIALGMCVYTQPAGVLAVPIYFAVGAAAMLNADRRVTPVGLAAAGVLTVLSPVVVWVLRHPESYADTFGRWAIHAAHIGNPWDGLVAFTRWHVMARRVGEYWHYFNPTFVFGRELLGAIVLPVVVVGLWGLNSAASRVGQWFVIAGLLAAPAAAVLLDAPRTASLAVLMIPFAATLAGIGVVTLARLWQERVAPVSRRLTVRAK